MEERRRTRSQGPPSLPESNKIRYWGSLPDPLQIERDHTEQISKTSVYRFEYKQNCGRKWRDLTNNESTDTTHSKYAIKW